MVEMAGEVKVVAATVVALVAGRVAVERAAAREVVVRKKDK